jgi:hypothetical protein
MRPAPRMVLLVAVLAAPALAGAPPAEAQATPGGGPAEVASWLATAPDRAAAGAWGEAAQDLAQARVHGPSGSSGNDTPGARFQAHLSRAAEAVEARDLLSFRAALGQARAALAHAWLERTRSGPGCLDPADLDLLGTVVDLARAPGFEAARRAAEAAPLDQDRCRWAVQRLLDRAAEEARVELRLAVAGADRPGEARVRAEAAAAWARILEARGEVARLSPDERAAWAQGWSDLQTAAAVGDAASLAGAANATRPLLLALGLGRTTVRLDDVASDILDGALALERAAGEHRRAPRAEALLLREAADRHLAATHAAVRRTLFLAGEGDVEPLDAALARLREGAAGGSSPAALRAMVEEVRADLARVAHLTFGAFGKARFVHVRADRPIVQEVQAGRFPFEGVRAFEAVLRFDPAVARVAGVEAGAFPLQEAAWDNATGEVRLRGAAGTPKERDAVLARITWTAAGAPLQETNVTLEAFRLEAGDGRGVELFLLRHGRVIVADVPSQAQAQAAAEEDPLALTNPALGRKPSPNPGALPAVLAAVAAAALVAARRRRGPR